MANKENASLTMPPRKHFTIRLQNVDEVFFCFEGQSILDALQSVHDDKIDAGCFGGGCGVCKIKIQNGDYECAAMSKKHVCDQQAADGFSLACQTFPTSDVEIEVCRQIPAKLGSKFGYLASNSLYYADKTKIK